MVISQNTKKETKSKSDSKLIYFNFLNLLFIDKKDKPMAVKKVNKIKNVAKKSRVLIVPKKRGRPKKKHKTKPLTLQREDRRIRENKDKINEKKREKCRAQNN